MSDTPIISNVVIDPLVGASVDNYVIEEKLAEGGMGTVYAARHKTIGLRAALKTMKPVASADPQWSSRFLVEARALAQLDSPHVVKVLNFGELPDHTQYLLMEFLDGETLEADLARRRGRGLPMSPAEALGIADQVLNGLAEAHKKGVVHRDLKPGNIMLCRTHSNERLVKLIDFGLARQKPVSLASLAEQAGTGKASVVAGTPAYIAPEQARGQAVHGAADLYALGATMFEMLTFEPPFADPTHVGLMKKHINDTPPKLASVLGNLTEGFEDFVQSLLAKDPADRPASADVARQMTQRLMKRIQADSTVQRPNPLLVVPAPFRVASPDALTPELSQKSLTTEPVLRTPTADKLERELATPSRLPQVFGMAALIIAGLVFLLWPRSVKVEPPVPRPPPAVERTEIVLPPKVIEVEPKPVEPIPAAIVDEALPGLPMRTKVHEKPLHVAIALPQCEVNDRWRRGALAQVADLAGIAARKSVATGVWFEGEEGSVTQKIRAAESRSECAEVEAMLASLQQELEKK